MSDKRTAAQMRLVHTYSRLRGLTELLALPALRQPRPADRSGSAL